MTTEDWCRRALLLLAILADHADIVRLLLEDQRADPNFRIAGGLNGVTPLILAVNHDRSRAARSLLECGRLDVNIRGGIDKKH